MILGGSAIATPIEARRPLRQTAAAFAEPLDDDAGTRHLDQLPAGRRS